MAINIKDKKTNLDDSASIYSKRDENQPEKERVKQMTTKEKFVHFKYYYLTWVLVIAAVLGFVGFILWTDVINKKDLYLRVAVLNNPLTDGALTKFGDDFTKSMKKDPDKENASFYCYYTRSDAAAEIGASSANDLSAITSRIVAKDLDAMIASKEDGKTYYDHGFFLDLTEALPKEKLKKLEKYLYIPDENNEKKHAYGLYIKDCKNYKKVLTGEINKVDEPILSLIVNSEDEGKEYAQKFIDYLFNSL